LVTKNIPFPLGSGEPSAKQEPLILGLSIRDTGELVLDGRSSNPFALDQSLRVAASRGVPVSLEIRPEAHSSYDNLANVLAIAHNNQITNLRVLSPRSDSR
jgi:biopolymer transport protein ExbD